MKQIVGIGLVFRRIEMSPSFRLACKLNSRAEFLQKFFAQAVKAAVGHDEKEIPGLASAARCSAMASELANTRASLPSSRTLSATVSGSRRFSPANCWARKNAAKNDAVAKGKRFRQGIRNTLRRMEFDRALEWPRAGGRASGLAQPRSWLSQRWGDARNRRPPILPRFASHIHPALHTAKRRERLGDLLGWDAASLRNDECRHGV